MNTDLLVKIINDLYLIDPRRSKKLQDMFLLYYQETDDYKKHVIKTRINQFVSSILFRLLSKESRLNIFDLGVEINERSSKLEKEAGDNWHIGYYGAVRLLRKENEVVITNFIPRSHGTGFYLDPDKNMPASELERESKFYKDNSFTLSIIATLMDKREDYTSSKFELKNNRVSREFVETLIEFLGLPKIDSDESFKRSLKQRIKS